MNEQIKINKEITQNLKTNEVDLNFLPGDLNTNISIEQYNLIINEGTFAHKKNTSENKILIVTEDNKLNKLLKILEKELRNFNIFIKVGFDFEDLDVINGYDKVFLNVNSLEKNILIILNYTCKYLIQTVILTQRPKLFIDYNALFSSVEVEVINGYASIRSIIMFILNKSKTENSQTIITESTEFKKDKVLLIYNEKLGNRFPFYRFNKSYINFKNIDQEYLNIIAKSEVEILINSTFEDCYIGVAFIKLSLLYGLNRCLVVLNATDKKNESKLLGCILMVLRILSKDENYFSEKIEDSNLIKINSFVTKIAKFDVTKINEIVSGEFLKSESIDVQDYNLFKIIRFSGFLNSKLIKLLPYKVNEFYENCNYSIASNFIESESPNTDSGNLSSYFLNEFLSHGKFNQYTLYQICKNSSKSIIQNQNKFLKVGNYPIVHFVIGHLILNGKDLNLHPHLCEEFINIDFSEQQKNLINFYLSNQLPNSSVTITDFIIYLNDYFIPEIKREYTNNRFSPQFGISNPMIAIYLSFIREFGSENDYHNLSLLIFSTYINYEWIFENSFNVKFK